MNHLFRTTQAGSLASVAVVWLVCSIAHGQDSVSRARDLFKQARALASDGKFSEACPVFEESLALESGLGTQFNLADCWAHVGRVASAYRMFLSVAEAASEKGETDRARLATERAVSLAAKLSRLQIRHDRSLGQLRVTRDHVVVEQYDWNRPTPVDPGHYSVELVSNKAVRWTTEIDVPARALTVLVTTSAPGKSTLALELANEAQHEAQLEKLDTVRSKPKPRPSPAVPPPIPARNFEQKTPIWPSVALLAGIGGVGVGTLSALIYQSKNNQAKAICPSNVGCSDADIAQHDSLVNSAKNARLGAYLGIGLGTASIATATIYYVTRPSNREYRPPVSLDVTPIVEPGHGASWGAVARGTF